MNSTRPHATLRRSVLAGAVAVVLVAVIAAGAAAMPEPRTAAVAGGWTAAWQKATGNSVAYVARDLTCRYPVTLSASGTAVRIRLSNLFVKTPTSVGQLTIATQSSGGAIVPGTSHIATAGGRTSFSLPAGGELTTDPVRLPVVRGGHFLISIFIAGGITRFSNHFEGSSIGHCTASGGGNHTADTTVSAMPVTGTSVGWLAGVDVATPTASRAIVALGDSITDGTGSTVDRDARWTDVLARRLSGTTFSVANAGLAGNSLTVPITSLPLDRSGQSALTRFDRDVLAQAGVSHVVLAEGTNDICRGVPASKVVLALTELATRAHSSGLRVIGGTIIGRERGACGGVSAEAAAAARATVNAWIRSTTVLDGVIDFAKAVDNTDPTYYPGDLTHSRVYPRFDRYLAAAYDSGDHVHPNDAGYAAMAAQIDLSIFR